MELNNFDRFFIIADTHLNKDKPVLNNNFLKILRSFSDIENSALIINGDFLDFWFENFFYDLSGEYQVLKEIKQIIKEKKYNVFLIKGNRDFVADRKFEEISGIEIIGDELSLKCGNKKFYITHGDIFCTKDISYKIWRFLSRSYILKFVSSLIPKFLALYIIKMLRSMSYVKNLREKKLNLSILLDIPAALSVTRKLDYVICGHNHRLRHKKIIPESNISTEFIVLHRLYDWGTYYADITENDIKINVFQC